MGSNVGRNKEEKRSAVGGKLKEARLRSRLTLKQVAERAGVTASFLSQVEHGYATLGSKTIERVAAALKVPVAYFFDNLEFVSEDSVIRNFERPYLQVSNDFIQYGLFRDVDKCAIRPIITELMPLTSNAEQFITAFCHPEAEFIYVLSGALTVCFSGKTYTLFSNDSIHIQPNIEHTWRNMTNGITKILSFMA